MRIFTLIFMSAVILNSCNTSRHVSPSDYTGDQIIVGSGGGVTGQWTTWFILDDGQVYKQRGTGSTPAFVVKLHKNQTRECFSLVQALNLREQSFNHPGNMTYLLGFKQDKSTWQVKWGDPGTETPKAFSSAYTRLMTVIHQ